MAKNIGNVLFCIIAVFYILIMIDLVFRMEALLDVNRVIVRHYNLIPFSTIWRYASGSNHASLSSIVINLIGNVVVFIPAGLYIQTI